MALYSKPKRTRPDWWTAEGVIERLQEGHLVGEICKQASDELSGAVRPVTLRTEIAKWKESATYGEALTRALKLVTVSGFGGVKISTDWYDEFFHAMDKCGGNAAEACEIAAIGQSVVYALLDARNKCYDPEFHERFRIAESARVGVIREGVFQAAEGGALKASMSILETQMPTLHGKSSNLHVTGEIDHAHAVTVSLSKEVVEASQLRVRALGAGRSGRSGNGGHSGRAAGGRGQNPDPWVAVELKRLEAERGGGVQVADIVEAEYAEVAQ